MKKDEKVDNRVPCELCGDLQLDLKAHYHHCVDSHGCPGQEAYRLGMIARHKWRARLKERLAGERESGELVDQVIVVAGHSGDELPF